jgi:hypothetical protein
MNAREINNLLEKYYDGRCSDEEEQILRKYFRETDVPQEFEAEKEMFRYYDSSLSVPEPAAGFEDRILRSIDRSERKKGAL